MPVSGRVALKNLMGGVTVLTPDRSAPNSYLEFMAAGDPSGGDVHQVTEEVAGLPSVLQAIRHGVIALEENLTDPAIVEAFQQQVMHAESARRAQQESIASTVEHRADTDVITVDCMGPGDRPGSKCGIALPVPERTKDERPPLCTRHIGLSSQFLRVEDPSLDVYTETSKKIGYRWVRSTLTNPERS